MVLPTRRALKPIFAVARRVRRPAAQGGVVVSGFSAHAPDDPRDGTGAQLLVQLKSCLNGLGGAGEGLLPPALGPAGRLFDDSLGFGLHVGTGLVGELPCLAACLGPDAFGLGFGLGDDAFGLGLGLEHFLNHVAHGSPSRVGYSSASRTSSASAAVLASVSLR